MTRQLDLQQYLDQESLEYFWRSCSIPEDLATKVILAAEQSFSPDDWQRMVIESSMKMRPYTDSDELDLIRKLCKFVDLVRKDPLYTGAAP